MKIEDRVKRDGNRWRYIYGLEKELNHRNAKQGFIRFLLIYSFFVTMAALYFALL